MKIVFMGTPQAAVPSLERILQDGHEVVAVWTQPDKPAGRGNKIIASPVKDFALSNGLPLHQPSKIKIHETLELFKSHDADVAVVVAYGRILPETFLQAFPRGAINVHFSLLPKYRGAAPVNWAIVNGETKTGVTTMQMDAGLDTGAMLLQSETEIEPDETAIDLMERLSSVGADLLSETLSKLDELVAQPQEETQATFAPIMKKEDGAINWNLSATEIVNRVRGFQPFPTSYTKYQDKKLTIWKATECVTTDFDLHQNPPPAGTIINTGKNGITVYCGKQSSLLIEELQLEGKKRMTARDFLNGVKIQTGEIFG